jgi:hypothetical protein
MPGNILVMAAKIGNEYVQKLDIKAKGLGG